MRQASHVSKKLAFSTQEPQNIIYSYLYIKSRYMKYGPINIDPETMSGTPVFTGTRVPVQSLFDYIESGETLDEFLENFPSVNKESAIQVLEMASKTLTSEKILNENFA